MTERHIRLLKWSLLGWTYGLGVIQCLVGPTGENFACVGLVVISATVIVFSIVRLPIVRAFPFSVLQIMMFWFSSQGLALGATLLDGNPLVENLLVPTEVFSLTTLMTLTLLVAHWSYRKFGQGARGFVSQKINSQLGLYKVPSKSQIFVIAMVGLVGMAATRLAGGDAEQGGGFVAKVLQGLMVFAFAPFASPLLDAMKRRPQRLLMRDLIPPGIYLPFLVAICLAANTRSPMILAMATLPLATGVLLATGALRVGFVRPTGWVAAAAIVLVAFIPLSNLMLGMQLARTGRGALTGSEMVSKSLNLASQSELIRDQMDQIDVARARFGWDEFYVNNPLMGRFMTTKFHDLGLHFSQGYGEIERDKLAWFLGIRLVAIWPAPVVNLLPFDFKKSALSIVSTGDYMYSLATPSGLGGFKTGSLIASGFALWSWLYFPIVGVTASAIFLLSDSLALTPKRFSEMAGRTRTLVMPVAFVGLLGIFGLANTFQGEGYDLLVNFLGRGHWQLILLYAGLMFLLKPFDLRQPSRLASESSVRRKGIRRLPPRPSNILSP